ncbi:isochorismatase family protein [Haloarcula marina]|uniref:isochorismatase family protein n=1 Tax=Haloarcula marina TaxID=2961574 RepID=UPI0020B7A3D3|nr:isochorismatase family protein [Halomicroarcula marina]
MSEDSSYESYVPDVVPEEDLAQFGGENLDSIGSSIGWGETVAVLVIDMTDAFVTDEYPTGRAATGQPAVEANEKLLETARDIGLPVFYTKGTGSEMYPPDYQGTTKSGSREKSESEQERWDEGNVITQPLAPEDGDVVIEKPRASAFFDTHLANVLHYYHIDTVILTGMTTSGCVRASAVDGHSSNFRMIIPHECTADRSIISHEISLFDIDMKYADVLSLDDVLETLTTEYASDGQAAELSAADD